MKILFLCYGHFDNGLELFKELINEIDITLVVQIDGDRLVQSIFDIEISDIPLGFHSKGISEYKFVKEIEKYFDIPAQKIYILKYNSLSLRDIKNLKISKNFTNWVKQEGFTHIIYYGSSLTWVQQLPFLKGIKRIYTVHDYLPHSGDKTGSGYQYKFYMKVITSIRTNHFLLLSKKMMDEFVKYYKVSKDRCKYILFGYFDSYRRFQKSNIDEEPYTILFFGRISPYKGIEYLVEATKRASKRIPEIKTIIAGNGKFYFDISKIIEDSHFEIYNQHINNDLLVEFINRCSIVVCPYTDATQSGVVMTAYAFNKPVIATDVGSFREYIINGETGIIVPPRNAEALAEAIKTLIGNRTLVDNMKENISRLKENEFSWEVAANNLINVYREID